jgi:hypothetical protein
MTSNITSITPASNGSETTTAQRPAHGLSVLRDKEAHGLISLGLDALYEASNLSHDLHAAIYDNDTSTDDYPRLQEQLAEVLACLETAEHYLCMLGSVFEDHPDRTRPLTAALNK